jgi:hypothetical protein
MSVSGAVRSIDEARYRRRHNWAPADQRMTDNTSLGCAPLLGCGGYSRMGVMRRQYRSWQGYSCCKAAGWGVVARCQGVFMPFCGLGKALVAAGTCAVTPCFACGTICEKKPEALLLDGVDYRTISCARAVWSCESSSLFFMSAVADCLRAPVQITCPEVGYWCCKFGEMDKALFNWAGESDAKWHQVKERGEPFESCVRVREGELEGLKEAFWSGMY